MLLWSLQLGVLWLEALEIICMAPPAHLSRQRRDLPVAMLSARWTGSAAHNGLVLLKTYADAFSSLKPYMITYTEILTLINKQFVATFIFLRISINPSCFFFFEYQWTYSILLNTWSLLFVAVPLGLQLDHFIVLTLTAIFIHLHVALLDTLHECVSLTKTN
jgi:hypothetical protein